MAFGRGGNGNRGGILRHWKLILGILVVLYLIGSMSSRTGRGTSSHERPGGQQPTAAAAEEEKKAEEPAHRKRQRKPRLKLPRAPLQRKRPLLTVYGPNSRRPWMHMRNSSTITVTSA